MKHRQAEKGISQELGGGKKMFCLRAAPVAAAEAGEEVVVDKRCMTN